MSQHATTTDRIDFVKRRIEERTRMANEARVRAIGATVTDAQIALQEAIRLEAHVAGMQNALNILLGL